MTTFIVVCAVCRDPLTPGEALEVTAIETGAVRFIHRPSVVLRPGLATGSCFTHGVGPSWRDRVRLVSSCAHAPIGSTGGVR